MSDWDQQIKCRAHGQKESVFWIICLKYQSNASCIEDDVDAVYTNKAINGTMLASDPSESKFEW